MENIKEARKNFEEEFNKYLSQCGENEIDIAFKEMYYRWFIKGYSCGLDKSLDIITRRINNFELKSK